QRACGSIAAADGVVSSPAKAEPLMPIPKILVLPGSTRAGSHNVKLAALAAKQLMLLDVDMTRISLADYPLPIYDADIDVRAGPAQQCVQAQTDDHGAPRCIHCKPRIQRLGHADSQECHRLGIAGTRAR